MYSGVVYWLSRERHTNMAFFISHDLPGRESSSYEIVYPACMMQRALVVLPAAHEMVFVEVFELGGLQNLSTMRQGCEIKLFSQIFIRSDQGWDIRDAPAR
jgi:hypothetical protein